MNRLLILSFIFLVNIVNSQEEKRLALVIGNANYDKAALKNPVNDAALMKQTLEKLNFDIIYSTNLERDRDMKDKIIEFGKKRGDYDVGFIYYAGHGIQIEGENYLLPTKEKFNCEDDILNYGVNVQTIMKYLRNTSNSVNVLVLDACRDNPLEQLNCPSSSRSLNNGGLAKLPAPTGSLIAFSTSANTTASDGVGDNSLFCKSLSTNLLKPDKTLNQIFQSVRSEVLMESKKTGRVQEPEEASKLIGDYYFIKSDKLNFAKKIISGEIDEDDLITMYGNKTVDLSISYYYNRGQSFFDEKNYLKAIENYEEAQKLGLIDSLNRVGLDDSNRFNRVGIFFSKLAVSYEKLNDFKKAIMNYSIAINILEKSQKPNFSEDSLKSLNDSYLNDIQYLILKRGELFFKKKYYLAAQNDFKKSSSVKGNLNLAKIAIEKGEYKTAKTYIKWIISELESSWNFENVSSNQNQHIIQLMQHQLSEAFLLYAIIKDKKYLDRGIIQTGKKSSKYSGKGRKHIEKALEYDSNNVDILFHKIYWIENQIYLKNSDSSKSEIVRLADEILDISNGKNKRAVSKKIVNTFSHPYYYKSIKSPSLQIDAIKKISEELIKNENDTSMLYLRAILSKNLYEAFFFREGDILRNFFFDAEKISIYSKLKRERGDIFVSQKKAFKNFLINDYTNSFKNPLRTNFNSESIVDENGFLLIDTILSVGNILIDKIEILNVENFRFTHEDDYIKACYLGHPTACNYLNFKYSSTNGTGFSREIFKGVIGENKLYYDENWYICQKENAKFYQIVTFDSNLNPVGIVKNYYMNDTLQFQGNLKVCKPNVRVHIRQGECSNYYKNGILNQKAYYVDDKLDYYIECKNDNGEIIDCEKEKDDNVKNPHYIKKFHKFLNY